MSGLLKRRPAKQSAKVADTSGLMAKPKTKDDETVEALLDALADYKSGDRHE